MAAFVKFDPWAYLEGPTSDGPAKAPQGPAKAPQGPAKAPQGEDWRRTLADLATLADLHRKNENQNIESSEDRPRTLAGLATLAGAPPKIENQDIGYSDSDADHQSQSKNQKLGCTPAKVDKAAKVCAGGFPFAESLSELEAGCPDYVPDDRWSQCVEDAQRFLATWGDQAEALGWTGRDVFGLHTPPENPHPSYRRLSRHDATGLIWGLDGCRVIALSSNTAAVENSSGFLTYCKLNRPPPGPLGDSLDDFVSSR